jgi:hypothetical protein
MTSHVMGGKQASVLVSCLTKPLEPDGRPAWRSYSSVPQLKSSPSTGATHVAATCVHCQAGLGGFPGRWRPIVSDSSVPDIEVEPCSLSLGETRSSLQLLLDASALAMKEPKLIYRTENGPQRSAKARLLEAEGVMNQPSNEDVVQEHGRETNGGISKRDALSTWPEQLHTGERQSAANLWRVPNETNEVCQASGAASATQRAGIAAPDCVSETGTRGSFAASGSSACDGDALSDRPFPSCANHVTTKQVSTSCADESRGESGSSSKALLVNDRERLRDSARQTHRMHEQKRRRMISSRVDALMCLVPAVRGYATRFGRKPDRATILEGAAEYIRSLEANVAALKTRLQELEVANFVAKKYGVSSPDITQYKPEHIVLRHHCR